MKEVIPKLEILQKTYILIYYQKRKILLLELLMRKVLQIKVRN